MLRDNSKPVPIRLTRWRPIKSGAERIGKFARGASEMLLVFRLGSPSIESFDRFDVCLTKIEWRPLHPGEAHAGGIIVHVSASQETSSNV
jgi:hypothetical protein